MFGKRPQIIGAFLFTVAFGFATWLEPWYQSWAGSRTGSANLLSVALGDSRRLFAKHFYVKADAYFHSGYYPSIFDQRPDEGKLHMAANAGAGNDHEDLPERGKPRDWIDRFGRHFYPSVHSHLGEAKRNDPEHIHGPDCKHENHGHVHGPDCTHGEDDHDDDKAAAGREERELLPWLKLAATLDPERPETYVTAAYWLRSRLGKAAEAERFLREGLQHLPGQPELLFELGRIYRENHKDAARARSIWQAALLQFRKTRTTESPEDILLYAQILGQLAKLEQEAANYSKAVEYLKDLLIITPNKASVQKWIDDLSAKATAPAAQ
jgi:tetratricopeptide (TPR) repeat protein